MKTIINITYGVLIGLLAAGLIWLSVSRPRGESVTLLPTATPAMLTIYVSGAVATPGVYTVPDGSRIEAAVQAAGGFIPGADQSNINLATLLTDGLPSSSNNRKARAPCASWVTVLIGSSRSPKYIAPLGQLSTQAGT